RIVDVSENHARAAEHTLFKGDVVVDRDIVLDLAVIADHHLVADEYVLAQGNSPANTRPAADVHEMPNARAFADLGAIIDDCAGVLVVGHGVSCLFEQFIASKLAPTS